MEIKLYVRFLGYTIVEALSGWHFLWWTKHNSVGSIIVEMLMQCQPNCNIIVITQCLWLNLYYFNKSNILNSLIDYIFSNLNANMSSKDYITSWAILSTQNDWVDMINIKMIGRFHRDEMVYHSFDCAVDDLHNYYPEEFLNTLTPNGLPPCWYLLTPSENDPQTHGYRWALHPGGYPEYRIYIFTTRRKRTSD